MIPRLLDRYLSGLPTPVGARYAAYKEWRWGDPHVRSLRWLCDRRRASIDVGAHRGAYTYFLNKYSTHCYAFEPNPVLAAQLRERFPSVDVRAAAVSDRSGSAMLRTPLRADCADFNRSTVEPSSVNRLEGAYTSIDSVSVPAVRLDDVIPRPVGMIKIDVEGHELSVLAGSKKILGRDRPNLIVELEERHHPGIVEQAFGLLEELGYSGYFFYNGAVVSTKDFTCAVHQGGSVDNGGPYVWNFIFSVSDAYERPNSRCTSSDDPSCTDADPVRPLR